MSLLGEFSHLPHDEFARLSKLSIHTLNLYIELIQSEICELEEWLGSPPLTASTHDILQNLYRWDEYSQYLYECKEELYSKEYEQELYEAEIERCGAELLGTGCPLCESYMVCRCMAEECM
jgi:hypothetical protein